MYFNELRVNAFNKCPAVFILVKTALILFIIAKQSFNLACLTLEQLHAEALRNEYMNSRFVSVYCSTAGDIR